MKRYFFFTLICVCVFVTFSSAQSSLFNTTKQNVAIDGYDVVSYFNHSEPLRGNSAYKRNFEEVIYWFASEANADKFDQNTKKYVPKYGGWCAYAMGLNGEKVEIDPKTFKIVEGRLYLFYNKYFNNTLKSWNENEVQLKRQADTHWSKILAN